METDAAMRICVFGDIQGWAQRLDDALGALGADVDAGVLPDNLVVVQVGDLVHKGPDSAGVLAIVDRFLAGSPGRWLQLIGNHETVYLGGSRFWTHEIAPHLQADLRRWLEEGELRVAVALRTTELGDVLVTHGGLTRWKWEDLGRPESAAAAARLLDDELREHPERALASGTMLWGTPTRNVGVVWAEASTELLWSWDAELLPFSQIHGHTSCFRWGRGTWNPHVPDRMKAAARLDRERRHEHFDWPDGAGIVGIDPGYTTKNAAVPLAPLTIEGVVL